MFIPVTAAPFPALCCITVRMKQKEGGDVSRPVPHERDFPDCKLETYASGRRDPGVLIVSCIRSRRCGLRDDPCRGHGGRYRSSRTAHASHRHRARSRGRGRGGGSGRRTGCSGRGDVELPGRCLHHDTKVAGLSSNQEESTGKAYEDGIVPDQPDPVGLSSGKASTNTFRRCARVK
jgi:hypothetical protein